MQSPQPAAANNPYRDAGASRGQSPRRTQSGRCTASANNDCHNIGSGTRASASSNRIARNGHKSNRDDRRTNA